MKKNKKEKVKNPLFRVVKFLFKEHKFLIMVLSFVILISSIGAITSSLFFKNVIDLVIMPGVEKGYDAVYPKFMTIIFLMLFVYIVIIISDIIRTRILSYLSNKFLYSIRKKVFDHMENLGVDFFDKSKRGDLMAIYTNDVETLKEIVMRILPSFVSSLISLVAIISVMVLYNIYFTLISLSSLFIIFLFVKVIGKSATRDFTKYQEMMAQKDAFVEEMMKGQKIVKLFCYEEKSLEKFNEYNENLFKTSKRANYLGNLMLPIFHNIGNILYCIIAIVGFLFFYFNVKSVTITGMKEFTVGTFVAFLALSRRFSNNFNQFAQQMNRIISGFAGSKRICNLLDKKVEVDDGKIELVNVTNIENEIKEVDYESGIFAWKYQENKKVYYKLLDGNIELKDVNFSYDGKKQILKNINISAKKGQKIALVGQTGAGKTTIANLLTRFYDIESGTILYDGFNIRDIKKASLRKSVGIVLQDITIFTDTVKNNIKYGNIMADDSKIIEASMLSNSYDFIKRLPYGFDTILENNGENLSQGQKQLLSISRTTLLNPPVLILDEATSSIDTRTELLVQKGLDNLIKDKTVFVIAHRLSTIRNSDVILVMDKGEIIECGNHTELLNKKGLYHSLYTGQLELE